MGEKHCFLISPIGMEGSEARKLADKVKQFLTYEVLTPLGYDCVRADEINRVGRITNDIIREILESRLVISLLDYENPNVYYEMALRHASSQVCVSVISREFLADHDLPFDMNQERVFKFPLNDMLNYRSNTTNPKELDKFKNDLLEVVKEYDDEEYEFYNPVTNVTRNVVLPRGMSVQDILDYVDESVAATKRELKDQFGSLRTVMEKWMPEDLRSAVRDMYQNGSATYISGEAEAFQKLTEMTLQAKSSLRTSRFAPQAIGNSHSDFFKAVCDFGKRKDVVCKRIMCMNEPEKENDIIKTALDTAGGSMQLFLTDYDNNFELVVIDNTCAFLHFYDENRYIKSTLFIRGERVVQEFENIYDRFLDPVDGHRMEVIDCSEFASMGEVLEKVPETLKKFKS